GPRLHRPHLPLRPSGRATPAHRAPALPPGGQPAPVLGGKGRALPGAGARAHRARPAPRRLPGRLQRRPARPVRAFRGGHGGGGNPPLPPDPRRAHARGHGVPGGGPPPPAGRRRPAPGVARVPGQRRGRRHPAALRGGRDRGGCGRGRGADGPLRRRRRPPHAGPDPLRRGRAPRGRRLARPARPGACARRRGARPGHPPWRRPDLPPQPPRGARAAPRVRARLARRRRLPVPAPARL
ncbi:MAG: hypothetical protein AVDCRST_MAG68-2564, partial [uncultured Gemmatimonadetes bacterium]